MHAFLLLHITSSIYTLPSSFHCHDITSSFSMSSHKPSPSRKPRILVKPIWRKKQSLGNFMNHSTNSNNHQATSKPTSQQEASSSSFSFFASQPQNGPPSTQNEHTNPIPQDHSFPPMSPTPLPNVNFPQSIKAQEFSNLIDLSLLNIILSQKLYPPIMSYPTLAQVDAHGSYCACCINNLNHFQKLKNDLDYIISILLSSGFLQPLPMNPPPPCPRKY